MRERECVCEDPRQLKTKVVFTSSSRVSFPRSNACALHMTRMRKVRTDGDSCVSQVARGKAFP